MFHIKFNSDKKQIILKSSISWLVLNLGRQNKKKDVCKRGEGLVGDTTFKRKIREFNGSEL
jgi:hypothetical protein